jgi:hypothetical protein
MTLSVKPVSAHQALEIADEFLANRVGNLLMATAPRLEAGCWEMGIVLGNAIQGVLGEVGTIRVDAVSGQVLFTDDDRAGVKHRARLLSGSPAPAPRA